MKKQAAQKATAAPVTEVQHKPVDEAHSNSILQSADTWIAVSFVICVVLVLRYLMPMIGKGLDGRAEKIRDQLEQAKRLRAEAEELLATYQRQQQELMKEAETILATAQRDAADMRTRATEELKQTLDRRSQQAQEKIARAEAEAIQQIRTRIVETAVTSARELIAERQNAESDERAVERAISAIQQQIH